MRRQNRARALCRPFSVLCGIFVVVSLIFVYQGPDSWGRGAFESQGGQSNSNWLGRGMAHLTTGRGLLDESKVRSSCEGASGRDPSKRILLTGSAGFIGFHTAKAFWEKGYGVVGFDNFNDYYDVSLKRARDAELRKLGCHTVEGDLVDTQLLQKIVEVCRITHVVHLAGQAGVRYAKKEPMAYVRSNVEGSVSVFEAARHADPSPQIVYASSSSVYGGNKKVPFSESDPVADPMSLYAATKRSMELSALVYHKLYSLSLTGLRFFTVYGPWGRPDMAYFAFAKNIVAGKPIRIFQAPGGGELARDFTYVSDITAGILGAVETSTPSTPDQAKYRIFNLGNTQPVTVSDFVSKLEKGLGRKAKREYEPLGNTGDVLFTHANVSAAHAEFGYEPKTSLEQGLKNFADWFYGYYGRNGPGVETSAV